MNVRIGFSVGTVRVFDEPIGSEWGRTEPGDTGDPVFGRVEGWARAQAAIGIAGRVAQQVVFGDDADLFGGNKDYVRAQRFAERSRGQLVR